MNNGTRALCIYKTSNGGNQAIHSGMSVYVCECLGGSLHSILWLVVLEVGDVIERIMMMMRPWRRSTSMKMRIIPCSARAAGQYHTVPMTKQDPGLLSITHRPVQSYRKTPRREENDCGQLSQMQGEATSGRTGTFIFRE